METIKNGLVAAALMTALTGCGAATLRSIANSDEPRESVTYSETGCRPYSNEVKVEFMPGRYIIECDYNHYFEHEPSGNFLRWGDMGYSDNNLDGVVDGITAAYIDVEASEGDQGAVQMEYNDRLFFLGQKDINRLWLRRWGFPCRR